MSLNSLNKGFLEFVYEFYKGIRTHQITLAYEGEINHQLMKAFAGIAIGQMSENHEQQKVQKKVYHVMIECLQNIYKHAFRSEEESFADLNHGILIISKNSGNYMITTGNIIEIDRIHSLNSLLDKINSLKDEDLHEVYKKQLLEGRISDKGGAGLGFVDIRRKTGQPLEYHFLPISQNYSFFLFTTRIERNI